MIATAPDNRYSSKRPPISRAGGSHVPQLYHVTTRLLNIVVTSPKLAATEEATLNRNTESRQHLDRASTTLLIRGLLAFTE